MQSNNQAVTALVLPETPKQIAISADWIKLRNAVLIDAEGIMVQDETQFRAASEILQRITKLSNKLETYRKEFTEPFLKAQKSIKAMADSARESLESAKEAVKGKLAQYAEIQRKREAEERAAAEKAAMEAAAQIAEDNTLAVELLGEDAPVQEVVAVASPVERRAVSDSVRVRKTIVFELDDIDKVPRAFLMLDDRLVNKFKSEHAETIINQVEQCGKCDLIPGIVFTVKTDVSSR